MIKNSAFKKYVIVVAILVLMLSFVSCGKGSLKLEAFKIDYTTIKTTYVVGDVVDFTGIQATAVYTDESLNTVLTYDDLTFEYDSNLTETPGEKQVKISFMDPHLQIKQEYILEVKVLSDLASGIEYPAPLLGFDAPSSLISFTSNNKNAGKSQYGDRSFSSEFAVGNQTYIIGNENAFKLNPEIAVFDTEGEIRILNNFYSIVEIGMKMGGSYVTLKTTDLGNNLISYKYQNQEVVKVDIYKGLYEFTEYAVGKEVKISVKPDASYYPHNEKYLKPVVLEAKIVRAYNIYEAWQLSVIDNDPNGSGMWSNIKNEKGISGLNVSGVVLHNDIKITAKDIPNEFFNTSTSDVVYTNKLSGEKIIVPAGTKYLKDYSYLFNRRSTEGFTVQGNMFTLDLSELPIVASPSVFGPDSGLSYGFGYAFCFVFKFESAGSGTDPKPSNLKPFAVNNLSIIGNASRNNLVDAADNLVSGGGIMFMTTDNHAISNVDNVIGNSFFCTYRVDQCGQMTGTNLKNYDAYLNFVTVMYDSILRVSDSYFNGSGGPAILAINDQEKTRFPDVRLTNTICETALTGQELWFDTMGIKPLLPQLFDLNDKLVKAGLGGFVSSEGYINVKGVLSSSGTNADEVIKGIDAQGVIFFDNDGIERLSSNSHWKSIYTLGTAGVAAAGMSPLFITVNDAKGNSTTIYYDGVNLCDLSMKPYTMDPNSAIHKAFNDATSITLTMGGISIVGEFFH